MLRGVLIEVKQITQVTMLNHSGFAQLLFACTSGNQTYAALNQLVLYRVFSFCVHIQKLV